MTLDEARVHVGHGVVYQYPGRPPEDGTITGVGGWWVFVRYRGDVGSKATDPASLSLLAGDATSGADEDSGRFPL